MDADPRSQARLAVAEIARNQVPKVNPTLGGSLQSNIESWTDSRSTIIELLQNADDVNARQVSVDITYRGVKISHDGNPFEPQHVAALCDVRQSTKDIETQTGFKGIGFKAVFLISEAPMVVQGPWSFEFKPGPLPEHGGLDPGLCWYLIPRWIEQVPVEAAPSVSTDTVFWLPFSPSFDAEAQDALKQKLLSDLHAASMLFLRSVRRIEIRAGDVVRRLQRDGDTITDVQPKKITRRRFETKSKRLHVPDEAKRQLRSDDPRRHVAYRDITVAFELDQAGQLTETKEHDALYYVFLPSEEPTQLPFLVQGDFLLDTQRSKLLENNPWNRWLHEETCDLVVETLTALARDARFSQSFLQVLPTKRAPGHRDADKHLLQPLYAKLADLPILQAYDGDWVAPKDACIAPQSIANLLGNDWLTENKKRSRFVPEHEGFVLRLKSYGTESLPLSDALQTLLRPEARPWLETRTAVWFASYYEFLTKHVFGNKTNQNLAGTMQTSTATLIMTTRGLAHPAGVFLQPSDRAVAELMARLPECALVPADHMAHAALLSKLGAAVPDLETLCKKLILTTGTQPASDQWTDDQYQASLGLLQEWWRGNAGEPDEAARAAVKATKGDFRLRTNMGIQPAKATYTGSRLMEQYQVPLVKHPADWLGLLRDLGASTAPRINSPAPQTPPAYSQPIEQQHGAIVAFVTSHAWHPWPSPESPAEARTGLFDAILEEPKSVDGSTAWRSSRVNVRYRVVDVASQAVWQMRHVSWVPTNQGLVPAGQSLVWPEDKTTARIARGIIPIVTQPAAWRTGNKERLRPFLTSLGIHFEPGFDILLDILTHLDRLTETGAWEDRAAAAYQELSRLLREGATVPLTVQARLDRLRLPTPLGEMKEAKSLYWSDVARADHLADTGALAWQPKLPRRDVEQLFKFLGVRPASRDLRLTPRHTLQGQTDAGRLQRLQQLSDYLTAIACHYGAKETDVRASLARLAVKRLDGPFEADIQLLGHTKTIHLQAHVEGSTLYSTFQSGIQTAFALVQFFGIPADALNVIANILNVPEQADEVLASTGIRMVRTVELPEAADEAPTAAEPEPTGPPTAAPPRSAPPSSKTTPEPQSPPPGTPNPPSLEEPLIVLAPKAPTWSPQSTPEEATGRLVTWSAPAPAAKQVETPPAAGQLGRAQPAAAPGRREQVFFQSSDDESDEVRKEVGKWGERFVNEELTRRLDREFPGAIVTVEGMDATYSKDGKTVATLRWHNREGESGQSPDFILTYATGAVEQIEVKATGVRNAWAEFTANEWLLARQHGQRFFVYRVWNAGREEVEYSIITELERRWRDGEFTQFRVKLRIET
ncbi:MAG: DUF3883 domain-containing protein [Candidatus Thermoplasmatota archaeon]